MGSPIFGRLSGQLMLRNFSVGTWPRMYVAYREPSVHQFHRKMEILETLLGKNSRSPRITCLGNPNPFNLPHLLQLQLGLSVCGDAMQRPD